MSAASFSLVTKPHLITNPHKREQAYHFLDELFHSHYGTNKIRVRQLVSPDELIELSDARLRLYSQRKKYYDSLFGNTCALDETDSRSYIFAIYYDGQIIGTQRVTPYPHESSLYIPREKLTAFVNAGYPRNCVEFSRLIIDKMSPIKTAVNALASTAGAMVALNTPYSHYITYVKPRLQERFSQFTFDQDALPFKIPSRGEHLYALYKGNLLSAIIDFFKIDCRPEQLTSMDVLIDRITETQLAEVV
jgi:N-acyl-L-homoserine lactone synthetase